MTNPLHQLRQLLATPATRGMVIAIQGKEMLVSTPRGAIKVAAMAGIGTGDKVEILGGVASRIRRGGRDAPRHQV